MAGHARLKFVMTECSKTQIRLAGLILDWMTVIQAHVTFPVHLPKRLKKITIRTFFSLGVLHTHSD